VRQLGFDKDLRDLLKTMKKVSKRPFSDLRKSTFNRDLAESDPSQDRTKPSISIGKDNPISRGA